VTLCAVCTVHEETRSLSFLVESQNQGRRFVSGLALKPLRRFVSSFAPKPLGRFVCDLTSKPLRRFLPVRPQNQWRRFLPIRPQNQWWRVSRFGAQNRQLQFGDLDLKITATIFWFVTQNQAGYGLTIASQNRWEDVDGAGHVSRSDGLLHVEVSRGRVF
jgi:hypothetical protein